MSESDMLRPGRRGKGNGQARTGGASEVELGSLQSEALEFRGESPVLETKGFSRHHRRVFPLTTGGDNSVSLSQAPSRKAGPPRRPYWEGSSSP